MTKKAITADPATNASSLFQQGKFEKEITPRVDFDSLLEKATKNIGGRLGIFSEPVWNSEDAEASNIWITIENENYESRQATQIRIDSEKLNFLPRLLSGYK